MGENNKRRYITYETTDTRIDYKNENDENYNRLTVLEMWILPFTQRNTIKVWLQLFIRKLR